MKLSLMTANGTVNIDGIKGGSGGGSISDILKSSGAGSSESVSNLGNSGSGKTMDAQKIASGIRDIVKNNPDISKGLGQAMTKFADKIDPKGAGKGSDSYGLSNGQDNKADANSLRKIADKLDGGNSAQNGNGSGLGPDNGSAGSQDPLQQLMKMLGMDGKGSDNKMSSADKKALKELAGQLKDAMDGKQGGGNALQNGGNEGGCDESEGSGNNLEAGSGSGSGGQISKQELGQAIKEFGDDLMKGDKGNLNDNSSGSGSNLSLTIKM